METTWLLFFQHFPPINPRKLHHKTDALRRRGACCSCDFRCSRDANNHHTTTMAKSLRSKTKLAARRRKAHESHYAVANAARTARISAKLLNKDGGEQDAEGDDKMAEGGDEEEDAEMGEGECSGWACAHCRAMRRVQPPVAAPRRQHKQQLTPTQRPRRSRPRPPASRAASSGARARAWLPVPSSRDRTSSAAPSPDTRPARPSAAAKPFHNHHHHRRGAGQRQRQCQHRLPSC